jgi:catechol 2,3-dioxygenase-like lactoylglutathione lyase family enzyme
MITCISLVTVYCLDQTETRDFYVEVLGFEPGTDITMGEGFRWVIKHPSQPELEVTLMTPGPPLDHEAADFVRRQLEKGGMGGLGLSVDDSTRRLRSSPPRASRFCRSRRTGRMELRP